MSQTTVNSKPLIPDNHVLLASNEEVHRYAEPLFDTFGINSFTYHKFYWTGSIVSLATHHEWNRFWVDNAIYSYLNGMPDFRRRKYLFMDEIDKNTEYWRYQIKPAEDLFDLCHGIALFERHIGYLVVYYYTVPRIAENFNRTFLLHLDQFHKFNYYFKNEAHDLMIKAEKQRYRFPKPINTKVHQEFINLDSSITTNSVNEQKIKDFADKLKPKRHYFTQQDYLTVREFQCSKLLISGISPKQIAKQLGISVHTVNEYITYIKTKLGADNKRELMSKLKILADKLPSISDFEKEKERQYEQEYIDFIKLNMRDEDLK